jgi:hypothetical protein
MAIGDMLTRTGFSIAEIAVANILTQGLSLAASRWRDQIIPSPAAPAGL